MSEEPVAQRCGHCGQTIATGEHRMSPEIAATYPVRLCPRCSGDGIATCAVEGRLYFQCGCGVRFNDRD